MKFFQKKTAILAAVLAAGLACQLFGGAQNTQGKPRNPVLTVLYDHYSFQDGCAADWGFAALIEGPAKTILYDTGTKDGILLKNVGALNIDLGQVDLVFISHDHNDHSGGLQAVLQKKSGIPVYVPSGSYAEFQSQIREKGGQVVTVKEAQTFFPGVQSTGDLGGVSYGEAIHEQALILDTPQGLVVVTGCAHPGIVRILEKAKEVGKKDIGMVLGGFHLVQMPTAEVEKIIARFKELGVKRVGATHCTGDAAIGLFRKAFGADFVEMGVGRKIELGAR